MICKCEVNLTDKHLTDALLGPLTEPVHTGGQDGAQVVLETLAHPLHDMAHDLQACGGDLKQEEVLEG